MPVIRIHNLLRALKVTVWLTLVLLIASGSRAVCKAQDSSACGHSTVDDAWGPVFGSQAKAFLVRLQRVVETNDKIQFTSLVHYPLHVLDGNHGTEISTPADVIRKYPSILTPDVRNAIRAQSPGCLFANSQGVMIGRGQIWFQEESSGNMKIFTINLSAPRKTD